MQNRIKIFVFVFFVASITSSVNAEVLKWEFSIDEQQVKDGPEHDGSTNSPGTGKGMITYDESTNVLSYQLEWDDLVGEVTQLHIHGPADSDNSSSDHLLDIYNGTDVPGFPSATKGSWRDTVIINPLTLPGCGRAACDCRCAEEAVDNVLLTQGGRPIGILQALKSGLAYVNVHTNVFGTGEIRGNLGLPVPEPAYGVIILVAIVPIVRQMKFYSRSRTKSS